MNTEILPQSIEADGHTNRFGEIHALFARNSLGKDLHQRVRFERYKPNHISREEWTDLLGADVNNLDHMRLTLGISRHFLLRCENASVRQFPNTDDYLFSYDEKADIQLASVIHDWGEAQVGDKMFDLKTTKNEIEESNAMAGILSSIFPNRRGLQYKAERVMKEVIEDRTSHTGRAFNAIERIGYMRTGLRAFDQSRNTADPQLQTSLEWCANNVLFNQVPALVTYSRIYPPVNEFMTANSSRITNAFTQIPESILSNYEQTEATKNKIKYDVARAVWQNSEYHQNGIIEHAI